MGPDEKPQGGEVSFGGGIVNRQGACVCGHGGVPTAVTQQPVHHLGVAKAGSQMQDCGTRIVSVLWEETLLVLSLVVPRSDHFLHPILSYKSLKLCVCTHTAFKHLILICLQVY